MLFRRLGADAPEDEAELTPEEEEAFRAGTERVLEEKRDALADPGPRWGEWFLYDGAKWWVGLGFVIVDSWVAGFWFEVGGWAKVTVAAMIASLVGALYLELLLYRFLWRRPTEQERVGQGPFRPGPLALREVGIWTPEAVRHREAAARRRVHGGGLDPREFL